MSTCKNSTRFAKLAQKGVATAKDLLEAVWLEVEIFVTIYHKPGIALNGGGKEAYVAYLKRQEYRRLRQQVRDLKRRKLITVRQTSDRLVISLTETGAASLLKQRIMASPVRTDGKIVLVLFDVPVGADAARRQLSWFLKSCGFRKLQQSVWMTKRDATIPLRAWLNDNSLSKWITIMLCEET